MVKKSKKNRGLLLFCNHYYISPRKPTQKIDVAKTKQNITLENYKVVFGDQASLECSCFAYINGHQIMADIHKERL